MQETTIESTCKNSCQQTLARTSPAKDFPCYFQQKDLQVNLIVNFWTFLLVLCSIKNWNINQSPRLYLYELTPGSTQFWTFFTLVFWKSKHVEVTSDSFCFLINCVWLFILLKFYLSSQDFFLLLVWNSFSQNYFLYFIIFYLD